MRLMGSRCEWVLTLLDREVGGDRGWEGLMRFGEEDVNVAEMTDVEPPGTFGCIRRSRRSIDGVWLCVYLVLTIQLNYDEL